MMKPTVSSPMNATLVSCFSLPECTQFMVLRQAGRPLGGASSTKMLKSGQSLNRYNMLLHIQSGKCLHSQTKHVQLDKYLDKCIMLETFPHHWGQSRVFLSFHRVTTAAPQSSRLHQRDTEYSTPDSI